MRFSLSASARIPEGNLVVLTCSSCVTACLCVWTGIVITARFFFFFKSVFYVKESDPNLSSSLTPTTQSKLQQQLVVVTSCFAHYLDVVLTKHEAASKPCTKCLHLDSRGEKPNFNLPFVNQVASINVDLLKSNVKQARGMQRFAQLLNQRFVG